MNRPFFPIILLLFLGSHSCREAKTEIVVCSTIHGAHEINPNYSFADLFDFIDNYDPDIIGVEIRHEDIDSSDAYLKRSYPFEMRECLRKYSSKKIYGFDWLGDSIKGRPIPENYFRDLEIKSLERRLSMDSSMLEHFSEIDSLAGEKRRITMVASLRELNMGTYDSLNTLYYKHLTRALSGTPYEGMSAFYRERDRHIANNIMEIIEANPGKKMLFLMGADHRSYTLEQISQRMVHPIVLNKPMQ